MNKSNCRQEARSRVIILKKTSTKKEGESTRGSEVTHGAVAQSVVDGEHAARKREIKRKLYGFSAVSGALEERGTTAYL